ncbi:dipeptide/oligopeptide/nickel ABC transporter ATP-binding protein [Mycolicibacterium smegmatis]|uniref:ABC transporter ATP-binding protein n=1 Tax=Mycolicibacterium smegmatis TaxID=1772 RepID=UPI0005D8B377|nr:dipeptide/oligopeptide/nickel ABC transporter ATP-binding protein [Mycolicibacterium smegmatis]MCP2624302.1 dipeptide/oligopeptide/nickel ABC transporter ATP-binding protein [Mycolicibacterium smegmatis]MDF1898613.1 dipeptide/oligopeptide/nickel ABC transporter ATP-binding protein [Mycolicibacterium smegmatis]MDF1908836.1 dipeptide/oligopeptide/nickel ABC transporter ATP-binding protein [Mycolicibacterium smegmatis]MDF1915665.1 dipeptide/oligopeptide/nickel ABC transporter ATP-binding protei
MSVLLDIDAVSVTFDGVPAVTDVTLRVGAGETVALVGGSGAGKSTLARAVAGLVTPTSGCIRFDGVDLTTADRFRRRAARRGMHLVFQDPYASLPPNLRVGDIVAEPQLIHRQGDRESRRAAALEALERVRLSPAEDYAQRFPHELSGGQRQRVAFARALVTAPRLLLADEPASGLDASLRVEIVDLMTELATTTGMAVVHITHDLALAARSCDRTVVMCDGRIVESGPTARVLATPTHEYAAALVSAAAGNHEKLYHSGGLI